MRKRRKTEPPASSKNKNDANVVNQCVNNGLFNKSDYVMKQSNMRVLVFAEKSSRLRFDSDTIRLATENTGGHQMAKSPCGKLMFAPQKADAKIIGDHIFGDAQQLLEAGGCKIHKNICGRMVVSRIFALPYERDMGAVNFKIETEVRSAVQLWNFYLSKTQAKNATGSYFDTEPPEYVTRISKSQKLSFKRIPMQSSNCTVSFGSSQRLGSTIKGLNIVRLIAIAVTFDLEFADFIINNIYYIDRAMRDLQHQLFEAFCGDKMHFHYNAAVASRLFRADIASFHNALRIASHVKQPTDDLFNTISDLVETMETKKSGYFLSKLISAVLMFHLSWAATTNEAFYNRLLQFWSRAEYLDTKTRPLLTVLGCVGMLSHTTRIVITGKDMTLVSKLLRILPYFVRYQRNPANKISPVLLKEVHFSQNNLWSYTKAELLARLKMFALTPSKRDDIELQTTADRWQLGEFKALIAQKTILKEVYTGNKWEVRYNYSSLGPLSMRYRARSEPHQHQRTRNSSGGSSFRPRSTSNPVTRYAPSPAAPKFDKFISKSTYPDSNQYTIASGKLPYGYSFPVFAGDKFYSTEEDDLGSFGRKYEHGEASKVWGRKKNYDFSELLSKKSRFLKLDNDENNSAIIHKVRFKKPAHHHPHVERATPEPRPGSSKDPYKEQPSTSSTDMSSNTTPRDKVVSPSKSTETDRVTDNYLPETSEPVEPPPVPFWKRNRKSSTVLARAMAHDTIHFLNILNADEIEEIYRERLNDIHYAEETIDEYDMSFAAKKPSSDVVESLFGGINKKFEPAFIVQGVDGNAVSLEDLEKQIKTEVQHPESFYLAIPKDSKETSKETLKKTRRMTEPKQLEFIQMTSVYILADVDSGKISVLSGDLQTLNEEEMVYPCDSVLSMMELFKDLRQSGASAVTLNKVFESSLDNLIRKSSLLEKLIEKPDIDPKLEDGEMEQPILFDPTPYVCDPTHLDLISEIARRQNEQDRVLSELTNTAKSTKDDDRIDATAIIKYLDCQYSDLRLLINVCSILSPTVRSAVWPTGS